MGTNALICDNCLTPLDDAFGYYTHIDEPQDICEDCWRELSYDDREWYTEVRE
jgi:hypothetical protein